MMPPDKFREWQANESRDANLRWYWFFGWGVVVVVLGQFFLPCSLIFALVNRRSACHV